MVNSVTNRYYPSWCISQQDFATILATVAAKSLINSGSSGKKGHLYTDLKDSKLKDFYTRMIFLLIFLITEGCAQPTELPRFMSPAMWSKDTGSPQAQQRLHEALTAGSFLLVDRLQLRYYWHVLTEKTWDLITEELVFFTFRLRTKRSLGSHTSSSSPHLAFYRT